MVEAIKKISKASLTWRKKLKKPVKKITGILGLLVGLLSFSAHAGYITVFPQVEECSIPQTTTTHTCSVNFSWSFTGEDSASIGTSSPVKRTLVVNGETIGAGISGNFDVDVPRGNITYSLSQVRSGTLTIRYNEHTPLFSYTSSSHNEILGDFIGNDVTDKFVQSKSQSEQSAIMPENLDEYLDPDYHVQWTGAHSSIVDIDDWSEESYGAFAANLTASAGDELLLLGRKDLLLLHGDIVTPIAIPQDIPNAIIAWDSNGNPSFTQFDIDADPDRHVVLFGDFDGDGYQEIVLQGNSKGDSLRILNSDGSIKQTIPSGYKGLDWSAASYELTITDINNDGRADIQMSSKVSGVSDNFAYSNASGNIDNVDIAFHQESSPKSASLAGTTGGTFKVSESGAATYSVPITSPKGTAGVEPQLSINYSSQSGNGPLGIGWNISGLSSVHRCAKNFAQNDGQISEIRNNSDDRFCLDGQQLFIESGTYGANNATYKVESFSNNTITSFDTDNNLDNGPEYFIVETRAGEKHYYGQHNSDAVNALVKATNNSANKLWLLERTEDIAGNYMQYKYAKTNNGAEHYIDEVLYTGNDKLNLEPYNKINFVYASELNSNFEREDKTNGYSSGSETALSKLLKQIVVYSEDKHVKTYQLYHDLSPVSERYRITNIQECSYLGNCFEPVSFEWSSTSDKYIKKYFTLSQKPTAGYMKAIDIDGNGISDLLIRKGGKLYIKPNNQSIVDTGTSITDTEFFSIKPIDIKGDGVIDLVAKSSSGWKRWRYTNNYFSKINMKLPNSLDADRLFVVDLDGDGLQDFLDLSSSSAKWYRQDWFTESSRECEPPPDDNICFDNDIVYFFKATPKTVTFSSGTVTPTSLTTINIKDVDKSLRFNDFNGDGVTDLVVKADEVEWNEDFQRVENLDIPARVKTSGYFAFVFNPQNERFETYGKITVGTAENITPTDLNQDGLTDVVYVRDGKWKYKINYGGDEGFSAEKSSGLNANANSEVNQRSLMLDYNNNGKPDFWLSNGGSLYLIYEFNESSFNYLAALRNIPEKPVAVYADFKGEGRYDLLLASANSNEWEKWQAPQSDSNSTPSADMITKITGGYDVNTEINYQPLTNSSIYTNHSNKPEFPTIQVTSPMTVVSKVTSDTATYDNGNEQTVSVSYQYEDFRVHAQGRGVLGFKKLITTDEQTGIVTETEYLQEYPYIGMPYKTVRKLSDGTVLSEAVNTWQEKSYPRGRFAYLEKSVEKVWTLNSDSTPNDLTDNTRVFLHQTITENTYDDEFGNLIESNISNYDSESDNGAGATQWFKTKTLSEYGSSDWEKKYARLSEVTVTKSRWDVNDDEVETSHFQYYPQGSNHNGSDYGGYAGMLKSETIHPNTDKSVSKYHYYDQFGNKTKEEVKAKSRSSNDLTFGEISTRATRTEYSDNGRFVVKTLNDLDHAETYTYDKRFASVLTQTGPNGLTSSFEYNEVGIKEKSVGIDQTYTTEELLLCGVGGASCPDDGEFYKEIQSFDAAGNTMSGYSREFYNKLGQTIVTTKQTFDGKVIVERMEYDKFGRVLYGYLPNFGDVDHIDSYYTEAKYDALGRLYEEVAPGNRVTTRTYSGLETKTVNAIGQITREVKNINGELLKVIDNSGKSVTYTYNSAGEFLKLTDSAGNQVVNSIDYAGHKVSTDDPDKGLWTYQYNGFGELIRQKDARGVVITQTYDQLGRMIKRVDNAAVENHSSIADIDVQTTCWTYDSAPLGETSNKVIGALHKVKLFSGQIDCDSTGNLVPLQEKISGYDELARPYYSQQKLKAEDSDEIESYAIMNSFYDDSSRVEFTILPEEVTLKNHYDDYGNLIKITDGEDTSKVYRTINDIDKFGNIVNENLGYGSSKVLSTKTYYADTGQLKSILTDKDLVSLEQTFDLIGNVTHRKDLLVDRIETFYYNEGGEDNLLNRLTSFAISSTTNSETTQKTYSYDALGNMLSKSDMGDDYRYGEGNAGPHAVTSIWDNNVKQRTFTYDANGNLTDDLDHLNNANNRQIEYGAFEKAVYIKKGQTNPAQVTFRYGSSRERYRRIDNLYEGNTPITVETTYMSGYEKIVHSGGTMDGKTEHKYYIGGVALLIETETEGQSGKTSKTHYMHKDHLGSVIAISDDSGNALKRFRYDPFGKQHEITDYSANSYTFAPVTARLGLTQKGFTGHEMIHSVGIIHMNGRIYDADIGRFMQADAYIQAPKNMQSMNRYSYVLNNPLSYTDPSGHFFKFIKKYWRSILAVTLSIIAPFGTGFWATIANGALSGAVATGSLKGALTGAFSAGVFYGIGEAFNQLSFSHENLVAGLMAAENVKDVAGVLKNGFLTTAQQVGKVLAHGAAGRCNGNTKRR